MNEDQVARIVLGLTCLTMAAGIASLVPDVERGLGLTPLRAITAFCVAAVGSVSWSLMSRATSSSSRATNNESGINKESSSSDDSDEDLASKAKDAPKSESWTEKNPGTKSTGEPPASSSSLTEKATTSSKSSSEPPSSSPSSEKHSQTKVAASTVSAKPVNLTFLYGTTRGTSKTLALNLAQGLKDKSSVISCTVEDLATYDFDGLNQEEVVIIVLGTTTGGASPDSCKSFTNQLTEATTDFRFGSTHLSKTKFAVFGVGSSMYPPIEFCAAAREVDRALKALGGTRLSPAGMGDDAADVEAQCKGWFESFINRLIRGDLKDETLMEEQEDDKASACGGDSGGEEEEAPHEAEDELNMALVEAEEPVLADVEDLAIVAKSHSGDSKGTAEMVTPLQRKNLTKQGYRLIGSHSAVKLCRWTKAQLRGRGGCYKHTAYGIVSYRCMEATPSLACANKCVFCWRTHTNPVGKEWRWKTDEPDYIVAEAVKEHVKMMKSLKGLPGASPARLAEAMTVRHCALSLVGEPIMYPKINQLLKELHDRNISSFLVTNAQFPAAIISLAPVTQLYCSVDASTREALKAVDRPLFPDFYERFLASLNALKDVKGRTVFRLTLVTGRNVGKAEDLEGYARLIVAYRPSLVEIKGVTFVGKSDASDLRMSEVPWHREVREFTLKLSERVDAILDESDEDSSKVGYGPACEHAHSVFCLLARRDLFLVDGEWYTWIDFDKFHELERRWRITGEGFSPKDYRAKTPSWALFDSKEEGFDPIEQRFVKPRHTTTNGIGPGKRAQMEAQQLEQKALEASNRDEGPE